MSSKNKIKIELEEVPINTMYMWGSGFTLKRDEVVVLEFGTTIPGGLPYIFVKEGKNKNKRFHVPMEKMKEACLKLL